MDDELGENGARNRLRALVMQLKQEGHSDRQIGERIGKSQKFVQRALNRPRPTECSECNGPIESNRMGQPRKTCSKECAKLRMRRVQRGKLQSGCSEA